MARPPGEKRPLETALQGTSVEVPPGYWDALRDRDPETVARNSLARIDADGYRLDFLNRELRVDIAGRGLFAVDDGPERRLDRALLELVILVYLLSAGEATVRDDVVGVRDLREGHFFRGPHVLPTARLAKRFGADLDGFRNSAAALGGRSVDMADAAVVLRPLPKIPLYFLLWEGDEEFPAEASVLFDRSIEDHFSADAIWGLVNLVTDGLVKGAAPF
jgi:hypothetical protein